LQHVKLNCRGSRPHSRIRMYHERMVSLTSIILSSTVQNIYVWGYPSLCLVVRKESPISDAHRC
jgi:hypothetical protein